ncbi:MAG: signal peptidase I, partial [Caulobacterales bacterium]
VPEGSFFFMGDNRDNSADSRYIGLGAVPFENLIGRAERIYWAFDLCEEDGVITCPDSRWFRSLHD